MKKVIRIGIMVYGILIFGIAFMLLGGPQILKEKNTETAQLDFGQPTGTLDQCSKHGFCIGDRVELNDPGVQAGMLPINGTVIKIADMKILTVFMVSDKTDENTRTIISEDWVQHYKPRNESNNAPQVIVQAPDNSEE
jgi:hypothetical protein